MMSDVDVIYKDGRKSYQCIEVYLIRYVGNKHQGLEKIQVRKAFQCISSVSSVYPIIQKAISKFEFLVGMVIKSSHSPFK